MRQRPDRAIIKEEWILKTINSPLKTEVQADGRIRKWSYIEGVDKYLRVILLEDGRLCIMPFLMKFSGGRKMKIRYFSDTDTALIELSDAPAVETKEITENLYIDLDEKGNLVSMTIEHAKKQAHISEISFLQMEKESI